MRTLLQKWREWWRHTHKWKHESEGFLEYELSNGVKGKIRLPPATFCEKCRIENPNPTNV